MDEILEGPVLPIRDMAASDLVAACRALEKRTFADFAERPQAVVRRRVFFSDRRSARCYAPHDW
jgi:hypothetical protein